MTLGLAPVLDFDGTLTHLDVDWVGLRQQLGVERIDDLWSQQYDWKAVTDAEVRAAETAELISPVATMLVTINCFAILTSNSADAVHRFFERFPTLEQRLSIVVGRDELGGPKSDFDFFQVGVAKCLAATDQVGHVEQVTYLGDSPYELDFARRLGMRALDVSQLVASERDQ